MRDEDPASYEALLAKQDASGCRSVWIAVVVIHAAIAALWYDRITILAFSAVILLLMAGSSLFGGLGLKQTGYTIRARATPSGWWHPLVALGGLMAILYAQAELNLAFHQWRLPIYSRFG